MYIVETKYYTPTGDVHEAIKKFTKMLEAVKYMQVAKENYLNLLKITLYNAEKIEL